VIETWADPSRLFKIGKEFIRDFWVPVSNKNLCYLHIGRERVWWVGLTCTWRSRDAYHQA